MSTAGCTLSRNSGLNRRANNLIAKGLFKTERYNDRPRIDKESFEAWYQGQKRYLKVNTRKEV